MFNREQKYKVFSCSLESPQDHYYWQDLEGTSQRWSGFKEAYVFTEAEVEFLISYKKDSIINRTIRIVCSRTGKLLIDVKVTKTIVRL